MLSEAKNKLLTQTGAGTPMGELLRRYWQPIAAVGELEDNPTKPVRLLGEDLVLYRDLRRHLRADRPALPAPPRRSLLRLSSKPAACAATITAGCSTRTGAASSSHSRTLAHPEARSDEIAHQGLSGEAQGRPALGLSRPAAGAAAAELGAVHLEERLRADRVLGNPVQLVPVPGELDRSRAFRVDARQLEHPPRSGATAPTRRAT